MTQDIDDALARLIHAIQHSAPHVQHLQTPSARVAALEAEVDKAYALLASHRAALCALVAAWRGAVRERDELRASTILLMQRWRKARAGEDA